MDLAEVTKYFRYLDELRKSGITNMYGSSVKMQEDWGLRKPTADKIMKSWMSTHDLARSAEERAQRALKFLSSD